MKNYRIVRGNFKDILEDNKTLWTNVNKREILEKVGVWVNFEYICKNILELL